MGARRRVGMVLAVVGLLIAGTAGALVVPSLLAPQDGGEVSGEADGEVGLVPASRQTLEAVYLHPARERERVRASGREDSEWSDAESADDAGEEPAASTEESASDDQAAAAKAARLELLRALSDHFKAASAISRFAINASPERDAATLETVSVAVGEPDEMALATFVRGGGVRSVDRAAELVGERRPELADGVPISLSGRVIDAETGLAVIGARVSVTSTFYSRQVFYDHHLREVAQAETDGDGHFTIERLNADPAHFGRGGRCYLTVAAEGFARATAVPIAALTPGIANRLPDVRLQRAVHTLTGRVLDLGGKAPVVGARVVATGAIDPVTYPKDQREALFVGAPQTVTDHEGRFTLEGLGAGVQTISLHGGDDCIGRQTVVLPVEQEVALRVRQIRGRITGRTVDGRGDPVAVVVVDGGGNSTHSFADGSFVLENFDGELLDLRFFHPDFRDHVERAVQDGATGLIVTLADRRGQIVLDVRDEVSGEPFSQIHVWPKYPEQKRGARSTSPVHLAEDGRHLVHIPDGASHLVVMTLDGRRAPEIPLAAVADGDVIPVWVPPVDSD